MNDRIECEGLAWARLDHDVSYSRRTVGSTQRLRVPSICDPQRSDSAQVKDPSDCFDGGILPGVLEARSFQMAFEVGT